MYLAPTVVVSPTFDPSLDCRIASTANTNSCDIVFEQTTTYLKVTIRATASYAVGTPNPFPYNQRIYVYLRNIRFPKSSSTQTVYPIYVSLYKSNIVNPTAYRRGTFLCATPRESAVSGLVISYVSNYFTSTAANYQTYPGALRF